MYMYQGLGQMLTKRLRHHQGCSETPKCAYVIYGQPLRGGPMSTRFPADLKQRNPNGCPPRTMSSKYHVPYLGYLAAASQPSFDTGNVPRTMRRHYFIKLCFREISTPPSVQSTQSNFLEIIISWRILRLDFNDCGNT